MRKNSTRFAVRSLLWRIDGAVIQHNACAAVRVGIASDSFRVNFVIFNLPAIVRNTSYHRNKSDIYISQKPSKTIVFLFTRLTYQRRSILDDTRSITFSVRFYTIFPSLMSECECVIFFFFYSVDISR